MRDARNGIAAREADGAVRPPALASDARLAAAQVLMTDHVTAEVVDALTTSSVDALVLKGPALAAWLYPGEVRHYLDSDILVAPEDWDRATEALALLGFKEWVDPAIHPPIHATAAREFLRGRQNVDLHRTLPGLDGDPSLVVARMTATAGRQMIGRSELRVPDRAGLLLNVGLHAAHHGRGLPLEDLRRAIDLADSDLWHAAAQLARELDGVPAFATGIKLLPAGVAIARELGIESAQSPRHELRRRGVQTAEGLDVLLSPRLAAKTRIVIVVREFFPPLSFMRHWTRLARRGPVGLCAAYAWRWIWLVGHLPVAAFVRWRVRQAGKRG